MRYWLLLLYLLYFLPSCAQDSTAGETRRFPFQLGNCTVYVSKTVYDSTRPHFIIQLHGNESTALEAARQTMDVKGGTLLRIDHYHRNISFQLHGKRYAFDPNRMFSRKGIQASLQTYGNYSLAAVNVIDAFARFFLSKIPDSSLIIALHNNSDNQFSALSYRNNKEYAHVAADLNINEVLDPDNFYFFTDSKLFDRLRHLDYNAVLQNNSKAPDDGSLSIWCGRRNRRYVNIEAQMGDIAAQQTMLEELLALIEEDE
jgi:hypothetical protein